MTRLMAWNILHGGGPRRVPEITLAIIEHSPDVLLLSEFRGERGGPILGVLADHGWSHQLRASAGTARNGLLLAARHPLVPEPAAPPRALRGRWIAARCPEVGLRIVGVHVPDAEGTARAQAMARVVADARAHRDEAMVLMGDFNAGRAGIDGPAGAIGGGVWLGMLAAAGFADAWRLSNPDAREGTWRSHAGASFRIDHVYVSARVRGRVERARHLDRLRAAGVSDHAPVLVELGASVDDGDFPAVLG